MLVVPNLEGLLPTPLLPQEEMEECHGDEENIGPIRLSYKPYFFSERTVFFSHNKSANNTSNHGLSAKRTKLIDGWLKIALSVSICI
jgi:hypothetical protein